MKRQATRGSRTRTARHAVARKRVSASRPAKAAPKLKAGLRGAPAPQVLYRFCKSGWAVVVEKLPAQQGTRFVCPFCNHSHRVSGPVRGFRKVRRAQWIKLHRVDE